MNVLITGGAGYIGSVCTEFFLNSGHAVTVYDSLVEGHRAAVDPRATFVQADCSDRAALTQALRTHAIDAVIHFAAFALVGESMQNPGKYFLNNTAGTQCVLDCCVEVGVKKFIVSSTCATYGVPEGEMLKETDVQRPVNPYGESKLLVERMLPWYHQVHGLEFVCLRYFNAAGASARFGEAHRVETHLIPNILRVALGQARQCEVFGGDYPTPDGTCVRDYIHVQDLALAHLLALAPGRCGFFNLGNGSGYSILEVIRACEQVSGVTIPYVMKPRRPGDPPRLVAKADKAAAELGWTPQIPELSRIVATAWDWHRRFPGGYPQ